MIYKITDVKFTQKNFDIPPCVLQEGVARRGLPEALLPAAVGNVSAHLSQRALLPTLATLLALGGSRELPLPWLFTTQMEEPRLPSQTEILLGERTPAERRERAEVAASKRQRRKALLRLRRAARAERRQHLYTTPNEEPRLPSHTGIPLGEQTPAERREHAEISQCVGLGHYRRRS